MERFVPRSAYRSVWLFVMFDLPVDDSQARREYASFRKELVREGFTMIQFSIYARYFGSEEAAVARRRRLRQALPPRGQVRFLVVTDRQFGKMEVYIGKTRGRGEEPPAQMLLF
ncbi:MAG: CRISPR-associated endonuclease Cas2 [Acidimicrobiales bacterium]